MNENPRRGEAKAVLLAFLMVGFALSLAAVAGVFDGIRWPFGVGSQGGSPGGQGAVETAGAEGEATVGGGLGTRVPDPPADSVGAREGAALLAPGGAANPASKLNREALEALERKDYDLAIDLLHQAIELDGDEPVFPHNLTESYLRRGLGWEEWDAALAVKDFDAALMYVADETRRAQIERLRDRARNMAEAEDQFAVESTLHFTFRFDSTRPEVLAGIDPLKVVLEETYEEYALLFRRYPVESGEGLIQVVFYDSKGFDQVTGLGDWAGGAFDGTIRVPVRDLRSAGGVTRITRVLRHETAHAFTHSIGGRSVPAWLNEGLAQWLEEPNRRAMDLGLARGRLATESGELFDLKELQGTIARWTDRKKIQRAYDQSLAFTAYLQHKFGEELLFDLVAAAKGSGYDGVASHFKATIHDELGAVVDDFAYDLTR